MEHETVLPRSGQKIRPFPLDLTEPDRKSGADKDVVYRWDPKSMYFVKVPRMSNGCKTLPDGVVASRPDPGTKRQDATPDKDGCTHQ
jgi:hypothetical protein